MNSIILTGTITYDGRVKAKMSQSAHHHRVEGSLDVFANDFSVTALIPSKCTTERPSPFRKISNWRRCLGAKDRGTCLKKRYRGPETDVQIGCDGVCKYERPETGVQTLHSPSYPTADVRLHFFAAK